jgi:hypothetical protein
MILNILDQIQTSFTSNNYCKDSPKLFTAINAAYLLTKEFGSKFLIFSASQSMTSLPKMKSKNVINIPKDELIYTPTDDKNLSTMGINMTNEHMSCDIFATSDNYIVK